MVEFLGIEMSNHTAYILLASLAGISGITSVVSMIVMNVADAKQRYTTSIVCCHILIVSLIVFIVTTLLAPSFRPQ